MTMSMKSSANWMMGLDDGSTIVREDNGTLFVLVSLPMFFTTTYVSTKEA